MKNKWILAEIWGVVHSKHKEILKRVLLDLKKSYKTLGWLLQGYHRERSALK